MMRKFVSTVLLMALSTGAMALGLGNIQLNSGLNQPFDARIELISPTASEIESLTVRLADAEAFGRAGIDRAFVLTTLRFEVQQNDAGNDYIQISSREAMREPFLNFLIEASWSSGKLFREYTVLLDPPLYDPNAGRQMPGAQGQAASPPQTPSGQESAPASPFTTGQTVSGFSGNEVGPISASETLWSVASRVRPDASVSVNQMMLALLRANPEAFINNNINGLKQGQILRVPDLAEINATSYQAAIEEVRAHNAMWEDIRANIATGTATQPVSTSVMETAPPAVPAGTTSGGSELRLVAAGDQTADTGQTGGSAPASATADASIDLLDEQVQSLSAENSELRDRLTESDQIIQDLRRLIQLRDDELAAMQQQLGGAPALPEEPAADPAGTPVEGGDTAAVGEVAETAPATETMETVDQTAGEPAEAAVEPVLEQPGVEQASETEEPSAAEQPALPAEEEVAAVEEPAGETSPMIDVEASAAPGLLDTLIELVVGNIMLIGGAIVAIVLAALVPVVLRKRREAAAEAEQAGPVAFPDFETADAGTGPASDGPQIDIDIDSAGPEEEESIAAEPAPAPALQKSKPVEPAPAAPEEEDPLAEVNVFLAYEHFDQAEEFVRDAITRQPANLDFHSKLLEVFYSAGERAKYEEEAKILHGLTGGTGPHWDMATIMWQEMSPNRPLFAEPAEGEESRADTATGGGIVDLTADDAAEDDDAGLDFDLGVMEQESAPAGKAAAADEMLDITAGSSDVLDVTASESGPQDEDILDVTAAVGLDAARADEDGLSLDLPARDDQDILDISASGTEDLLDVTAHTDLEAGEEDLLDVTMTGNASAGQLDNPGSGTTDGDNLIDFDIGGLSGSDSLAAEASQEADGIELDFGTDQGGEDSGSGLSLDSGNDVDGGIELDFGTDTGGEDSGSGLSLDSGNDTGDGGIELDFSSVDEGTDGGLSLDLQMDEGPAAGIDMDSTVKIPKHAEISLDDLEDDDEGDHTVFVARTSDTNEQSSDDENATKLDLAKAYVELGDQENAKSILEEVIAGGNAAQRRQAQDLMAQIG